MPSAIHDVITHTNFGEDLLRGFGVVRVGFWPFPLTCFVAITTLSLKCVIQENMAVESMPKATLVVFPFYFLSGFHFSSHSTKSNLPRTKRSKISPPSPATCPGTKVVRRHYSAKMVSLQFSDVKFFQDSVPQKLQKSVQLFAEWFKMYQEGVFLKHSV